MRFIIDISSDKEKDFLDLMKVLRRVGLVRDFQRKGKKDKNDRGEDKDVSSREMANQYRDLVD